MHEVVAVTGVHNGTSKVLFVIFFFGGSINPWNEDYKITNDILLPNFAYEFETGVRNCEAHFNAEPKHFLYGYAART